MKDSFTEEERKDIINYRLKRSHETLHAADVMINAEEFHSAVNRLYYACYYALSALLIKYKINTGTHHGAKSRFGEHFIMTGRIEKKYSIFYSQLFNSRNEGDYDDFVYFDQETVTDYRTRAKEFLEVIERNIHNL
ncbi:HEPN domain-containing protein [Bacteroides sp. 51]|uniref:HEPN domain-containing protein n=1 Tax=Bacteroides sp. 51 TaxID=2302938 RepID=UPI0013D7C7FF|nr:HEPN domain-containing protein [Bacteroides sp. 51]